jgi:hypothetical protein
MSGSGKSGNNRRKSPKHQRSGDEWQNSHQTAGLQNPGKKKSDIFRVDRSKGLMYDRPKWTPVKLPADSLPAPDCSICGKPVKDISAALTDRASGEPAHFDCVIARVSENEIMEKGDAVTYIGGGRFGVVHFNNPQDPRNFRIKRIIEWEDKGSRADWRQTVADHYSVT